MALSFGVTVLPDPPASRLVELMQLGERNGFEIGWTYDSHVLWQESFVQLTMAIQATSTMKFGHLVTNPGTREPTVLASLYATMHDISDGRMVMGIGRGDSARRYIGQQPVRVAEFERRLAMIKPFMNGKEVAVERQGPPAQVGAARAAGDPDVGRGLRTEGARRRRPRRRRRRSSSSPTPRSSSGSWARPARRPRRRVATPRRSSASSARRATSARSRTAASRLAGSRRWSRTTSRT